MGTDSTDNWSKRRAGALKAQRSQGPAIWDPNHLLSGALKIAEARGKLHPDCCERKGFLWGLAVAYYQAFSGATRFEPILLNGPVVNRASELQSILETMR